VIVTLAGVGLLVAAGSVILFLLTPADRRRGLAGTIGVALLVFGASARAPSVVQDATQVGAAVAFALGTVVGGLRLREVRGVLVVLAAFTVIVLTVTQLAFPLGTLLFVKLMAVALSALACFSGFSSSDRSLFLTGVLVLAAVESCLGVLESFVVHEPLPWGYKVQENGSAVVLQNPLLPGLGARVSGSVGHPIPYGTLLGFAVLVLVDQWRRRRPVLRWVLLAAFLVGIVLSGSRSVIIGVVVGVVLILWSSPRGGRALRVFAVAGVAVVGSIVFASDIAAALDRLVTSGSYTNRAGAFDSVPGLLGRAPLETLFGSGFGSDFELYYRGFFPQDGFLVIDNQLVTSLGTEGVVGVALVVTLFVLGWLRGGRLRRAWLVLFGVMLFSFDYFGWFAMLALLVVALAIPGPPRPTGPRLESPARDEPRRPVVVDPLD